MIIDSHCHLHDPAFVDVRETLRTAMAYDVWGIVAVGCEPAVAIRRSSVATMTRDTTGDAITRR